MNRGTALGRMGVDGGKRLNELLPPGVAVPHEIAYGPEQHVSAPSEKTLKALVRAAALRAEGEVWDDVARILQQEKLGHWKTGNGCKVSLASQHRVRWQEEYKAAISDRYPDLEVATLKTTQDLTTFDGSRRDPRVQVQACRCVLDHISKARGQKVEITAEIREKRQFDERTVDLLHGWLTRRATVDTAAAVEGEFEVLEGDGDE